MLPNITITSEDVLYQVKLSCKIPEIIEQIIICKIIENTATEAGIKVKMAEVQKAADQFRLINQIENAHDTWVWLEKHSLSLDDFEKIFHTNLLANKLAQHLFADKVEPYFFEHQLDYAAVVMYEIVLEDEDLALELFYAVKEGEMSFYDVAHKYIPDTESCRKGGYQGILRRKDLKAEISAAIFAAKPPQVLKPFVTSKGMHLILVEEIIQPELNDKLRHQIISDLFKTWVKGKIAEVKVLRTWQTVV